MPGERACLAAAAAFLPLHEASVYGARKPDAGSFPLLAQLPRYGLFYLAGFLSCAAAAFVL